LGLSVIGGVSVSVSTSLSVTHTLKPKLKTALDQLRRASISIVLNIAEGTSRFSDADKRNFYVIARGSVFECVAIFDLLRSEEILLTEKFSYYYTKAEEISKMLYSMIRNLEKDKNKK
jgi:four helix bundle protein